MRSSSIRARTAALLTVLAVACGIPNQSGAQAKHAQLPSTPGQAHAAGAPSRDEDSSHVHRKHKRKYDLSRIGNRGVGGGTNVYSAEREQRLGRKLARDMDQHTRFISDPVVLAYVDRVVHRLASHSDATVPFTVKIIDNEDINVLGLPGGFLYISTGLLLAAENEAELAGAIAHEIAHMAARHATKLASKSSLLKFGSLPLMLAGPAGILVRQIAGVTVPMKFSRDAEREADILGLQYQYSAGYDPSEFVRFLERLYPDDTGKPSRVSKAFATFPAREERIQGLQEVIAFDLPPRPEYVLNTSDFVEAQSRVAEVAQRPKLRSGGNGPVLRRRRD